jgi:hypothetical protein
MDPDAVQWMLICELVRAHPETITVGALQALYPGDDVEEAVARLQIDGLVVRFGDWVKASEPAVRFDQLARVADPAEVHAIGRRAAW